MVSNCRKLEWKGRISASGTGFFLFEAVIYLACSALLPLVCYPILLRIYQASATHINRSDRIVQAFFNLDRLAHDLRHAHQERNTWQLISAHRITTICTGPKNGSCSWYVKNNKLIRRFDSPDGFYESIVAKNYSACTFTVFSCDNLIQGITCDFQLPETEIDFSTYITPRSGMAV